MLTIIKLFDNSNFHGISTKDFDSFVPKRLIAQSLSSKKLIHHLFILYFSKDNKSTTTTIMDVPKKRKTHRESKKKDCPAQIHIRTVHRFPTYNCMSNDIQPVKTTATTTYVNKCQRGIILAQLREDIMGEKVKGEQGFWVRVPLPEVHQNHSLGPFDGDEPPLTEDTCLLYTSPSPRDS